MVQWFSGSVIHYSRALMLSTRRELNSADPRDLLQSRAKTRASAARYAHTAIFSGSNFGRLANSFVKSLYIYTLTRYRVDASLSREKSSEI